MLVRYIRGLAALFLCCDMVGCAIVHEPANYVRLRETAYIHAYEVPPLQVPPGYSNVKVGDDYVIPPVFNNNSPMPVNIVPPGLGLKPVSSAR